MQEENAVSWVHEDPVTKTKKRTDSAGAVTSTTLVDPWGGEVAGVWAQNPERQQKKFTTYERDASGRDEAQQRSYSAWHSRFDQADPWDGSYDLSDPQSLNRYAYVRNDPVNFVDPSGLNMSATCFGTTYTLTTFADGVEIGSKTWTVWSHCVTSGGGGGLGGQGQGDAGSSEWTGCITGRWLINNPVLKSIFNEMWEKTQNSGKENGGWLFYEPKTNTIHVKYASEGTASSMPNEDADFKAQQNQFRQSGMDVHFIGMFHTHPGRSPNPSGSFAGDMGTLAGRNNVATKMGAAPMGFVIYGPGKYTPYDEGGVLSDINGTLNGVPYNDMKRCL